MKKEQKLQKRVFTILVIILAIILLCYFLFYIVTNATEIYKQYGIFTWQFFYEVLFLILKTLGKIIFNPFTFIFGFPFVFMFICCAYRLITTSLFSTRFVCTIINCPGLPPKFLLYEFCLLIFGWHTCTIIVRL